MPKKELDLTGSAKNNKNQPDYLKTIPRAQFDVFKLYANFSKKFTLPKMNALTNFVSEINAQYAKQTLFGSEQFLSWWILFSSRI